MSASTAINRAVPLLLRPKVLAFKNRWQRNFDIRAQTGRDMVILLLSLIVMFSIYRGGITTLHQTRSQVSVAYFQPSLPLGLVLMTLLGMLLFSNCVTALGALLLSRDLDLILASPVSTYKFFTGKFLEILGSSGWMAMVFAAPVIVAFGASYGAPPFYYIFAITVLAPYFAIPSAVAVIGVLLFSRVVPANRAREVLIVCGLAAVGVGVWLVRLVAPAEGEMKDINDLLQVLAILSVPNSSWSPSYWTATCLSELLESTGRNILPYFLMLYSVAIALSAAAYLAVRQLHYDAYSRSRSSRHAVKLQSRQSQSRLQRMLPFLGSSSRALVGKEIKLFTRDMTHAVQLMLLLALCMLYLYNFRFLHVVQGLPGVARAWWQGFLIICNAGMGAFVITAVSTRFVFPSISMEGQSFWVLQTSPLDMRHILRVKFWCWFVAVSILSSVILASGALAINVEPHIVVATAEASWIVVYGIVGLGIGLGGCFAQFDWEHTSQVAATFGSLIYMLTSTLLIFVNLLPISFMVILRTLKNSHNPFSPLEWYAVMASSLLLLMYINYATTRWALRMGENSLLQRMREG